jgi:hypothetical protein
MDGAVRLAEFVAEVGGPNPGGDGASAAGEQDAEQELGKAFLQASIEAVGEGVEQSGHERRQVRQ